MFPLAAAEMPIVSQEWTWGGFFLVVGLVTILSAAMTIADHYDQSWGTQLDFAKVAEEEGWRDVAAVLYRAAAGSIATSWWIGWRYPRWLAEARAGIERCQATPEGETPLPLEAGFAELVKLATARRGSEVLCQAETGGAALTTQELLLNLGDQTLGVLPLRLLDNVYAAVEEGGLTLHVTWNERPISVVVEQDFIQRFGHELCAVRGLRTDCCWFCQTRPAEANHRLAVPMHRTIERDDAVLGNVIHSRAIYEPTELTVARCAACADWHTSSRVFFTPVAIGSLILAGVVFLVGVLAPMLRSRDAYIQDLTALGLSDAWAGIVLGVYLALAFGIPACIGLFGRHLADAEPERKRRELKTSDLRFRDVHPEVSRLLAEGWEHGETPLGSKEYVLAHSRLPET